MFDMKRTVLPHHQKPYYQSFLSVVSPDFRDRPPCLLLTTTGAIHGHNLPDACGAQVRAQCLHETGHKTGSVMKDQDNAKTLPDVPGNYLYYEDLYLMLDKDAL